MTRPAPTSPGPRPAFGVVAAWRSWRNRCRPDKMSSAELPSAFLAQSYLTYLSTHFEPCPRCGECRCRWAVRRDVPLSVPPERRRQLDYLHKLDRDRRSAAPIIVSRPSFDLWHAIVIAVAIALLVFAAGCTPNRTEQAEKQNAALHATADKARANDAKAAELVKSANADSAALHAEIFAWFDQPDPRPTPPLPQWKGTATHLHDDLAAAYTTLSYNPPLFDAIGAQGDALQETTEKAEKDKNDPWRAGLFWVWLAGGLCVPFALLVLWWTEKLAYAGLTLAMGLCLILAAKWLGWTLDHPYLTVLLGLAGAAVAVAVDWVRHPDDGWGHWLWSSLKKHTPAARPAATDVKAAP